MQTLRRLLAAVILACVCPVWVDAQTVTPIPVGPGGRFTWNQEADSAAEAQSLTYKLYKDALPPVTLIGVTCGPPVVGTPAGSYPCEALPMAVEAAGVTHRVRLTAGNPIGESDKSGEYAYVVDTKPAAPVGLKSR